ncbi:AIPR family protein [Streptomyces sp. NPDC085929]|uniref:AIPR family protein n=1 Tax=Streptomyces sp. NPDC085929 TaxID=3365739 RepID=UPI0037D706DC
MRVTTGEDFWWFNNGVTVVADEARIIGKRIVVKDPQIVNGLQTSHEVYSYFQSGGQHRDRPLLVEIVVAPENGTARERIIRATNSQTQLPADALRATEPIQMDIEESLTYSGGYYYERRASYYRNLGFPVDQVVSMARRHVNSRPWPYASRTAHPWGESAPHPGCATPPRPTVTPGDRPRRPPVVGRSREGPVVVRPRAVPRAGELLTGRTRSPGRGVSVAPRGSRLAVLGDRDGVTPSRIRSSWR